MDRSVLANKQLTELKGIASHLQMRGYQRLKKAELIDAIVRAAEGGGTNGSAASDGPDGGDDVAAPNGNGGRSRTKEAAADAGADQGGDETRSRVRTRTRERTHEPRAEHDGDTEQSDDAPAAESREPAPEPQAKEAGGDAGDTDQGHGQQRGDDDAGRRRRSRRERRRGKGGAPQPSQGQQRGRDDDGGTEPGEVRSGVLDVLPEGYGFMRTSGYLPGEKDVYVSQGQIRKHGLRRGDLVEGPIRVQRQNEKVPGLHHVASVNGVAVDQNAPAPQRPDFKDMTPLFPDERLGLETPDGPISMRIIDLMAPIGKGQRGLIVSPPKAGKTTILKELGQAIARNNPEVHLMVVLVDERPEEVTDMQRSIDGEVIASTFDRPADDHTQIAELAGVRAERIA
jgi:transcription termination factor Rho